MTYEQAFVELQVLADLTPTMLLHVRAAADRGKYATARRRWYKCMNRARSGSDAYRIWELWGEVSDEIWRRGA